MPHILRLMTCSMMYRDSNDDQRDLRTRIHGRARKYLQRRLHGAEDVEGFLAYRSKTGLVP